MTALDIHLFRTLNHALSAGFWIWPLVFLSVIGGGYGAVLVVPITLWKRTRPHALALSGVLVTQALLVFTLKRMVARQRPHFDDLQAFVSPFSRHVPTDFSFPSGHASGSFAFCVFLAIVAVRSRSFAGRPWLRVFLVVLLLTGAVGVGLSRIALGVHFPGDVLGGALLGSAIAVAGAQIHFERRRRGLGFRR